jgi:hypothetical protein
VAVSVILKTHRSTSATKRQQTWNGGRPLEACYVDALLEYPIDQPIKLINKSW